RSRFPHAEILKVDVSEALRIPEVKGVLTAEDIPFNLFGPYVLDQPILCGERVRYMGDPIVALAAESREAAREALEKIRVDYRELPALFDPFSAMELGAPLLHPDHEGGNIVVSWKIQKGELEAGFREAELVVEERYTSQVQEHAFIEPHACIAQADPSGKLTIHTTSSRPFVIRNTLCQVLQMPMSKIRVINMTVGGSFGGKNEIAEEPLAALLALKTGRPVKFEYSREEEFLASTTRHAFYMDFKSGVKRDGTITAREIRIVADSGAYCSWGETTLSKAALMSAGPYRVPNLKVDAHLVYTNNGLAGACRGFGATQACFACESHTDTIVHRLGMDSREFRLRNAMRPGDRAHSGDALSSCGVAETIEEASKRFGWDQGLRAKAPSPGKRRGRGIASMIYPIGFTAYNNPSSAFVRVNEDGTATVWTGCADVGQGSTLVLAQIAAEELGIPLEQITMVIHDTDLTPLDIGTVASRVTHIGGNALKSASAKAKKLLLEMASRMLEAPLEDLVCRGGRIFVRSAPEHFLPIKEVAARSHSEGRPVLAEGFYNPDITKLDPETGQGKPYDCYVFATHIAEVEVDEETGEVRVLRLVAAHDVGTAVNPVNVEGQIEGGVSQGVGLGLMEELRYRQGVAENPDRTGYSLPTSLDMPVELRALIVQGEEPSGPFGAKGVGEPALNPTAPAICNAIFDAVGVRVFSIPAIAEKILLPLRDMRLKRA
ncbi:MAG: xanthine dehydrogenase family protein molybdopterin-binding subunit, partial [Nitrospinota bacterium]